ncbi:MAG: hypothetical protein A2912_03950 [Candidatus Buchananbacteria bacterium RIFCSPLOWO2_01_FULL_40_23b]|uniref:Uncharacterized protein n=1 Tax=Candidatus Buchananbacteria bacterium RIFCSPLOWO2_01_FULL_40_23b TaxID=1797544 RepID=A0A1G1YN55_9BACT|nr:MAG: hypothetical protein A2912_03950 [Candidatus Buchananbacteria bacterium RIFCSPLOWO2_01_FULL_40_23b]
MDHRSDDEVEHRSPQLNSLLTALQTADDLFSYNVPPAIRTNYDNKSLDQYLRRVYEQPEFHVKEPIEIEKYIQIGDKVIKVGDYKKVTGHLKKDTLGVYVALDEKDQTKRVVDFYQNNRWSIRTNDLLLTKRPRLMRKPLDFSHLSLSDSLPSIEPKDIVKYTGEDIILYNKDIIPEKSEGLVSNIYNTTSQVSLHIIWQHRPGLVQCIDKYYQYIQPSTFFSCDSITLVRKNHVNFPSLYEKHMNNIEQK